MIRALMVDVDGVLVRGRTSDGRPWGTGLEADLGIRPADLLREFFTPHWHDVLTGRATLSERLEPVLAALSPSLPFETLIRYWFDNDSRIDTALLEALGRYRASGLLICLCTNQEHRRMEFLLDGLALREHVDAAYHSAAIGAAKPDLAFFRGVSGFAGIAPDELLLIDDLPENVGAARLAGWKALHWTGERPLPEALADLIP